jgi:hypothetical protein
MCSSWAFQWMVMSVDFDNLKCFGQFRCPALACWQKSPSVLKSTSMSISFENFIQKLWSWSLWLQFVLVTISLQPLALLSPNLLRKETAVTHSPHAGLSWSHQVKLWVSKFLQYRLAVGGRGNRLWNQSEARTAISQSGNCSTSCCHHT